MRRDMDLIRQVLLATEASGSDPRGWVKLEIAGIDKATLSYHVQLLDEAGFIVAQDLQTIGPNGYLFQPKRLTWAGHEFLDDIRDPEVWRATKDGAQKVGSFSLDVLSALAKGFLKKRILDATGIELDI